MRRASVGWEHKKTLIMAMFLLGRGECSTPGEAKNQDKWPWCVEGILLGKIY